MYEVLKRVFKHKEFKSDLQKRAVQCVFEGICSCQYMFYDTTHIGRAETTRKKGGVNGCRRFRPDSSSAHRGFGPFQVWPFACSAFY